MFDLMAIASEPILPPARDSAKSSGSSLASAYNSSIKLELIFGSLWRPPPESSVYSSWSKSNDMVCTWQLSLLPKSLSSGSLEFRSYVVGDDAFWHNLESRWLNREWEFWLEQLRQNHVCEIIDLICFDLAQVEMIDHINDLLIFSHIVEIASCLE
ncbi:hypothetical protein AALP_AA7G121200 [Arabis alpina]|uniref:Uncharacterized protein n=1 Tax=Arabis alpina TaxID=50452 RepID=A0A087GHI9_ARAAL|nr:hypothetical protein AALP_AA7G121200 [Arabis alpina]